jgi:prepilin-type processing-associated H-X9-DG protein
LDEAPAFRGCVRFGSANCYMWRFCVDRHIGGTNGLFFDLSARKVGLKELWELEWHRNWNPNNDPPPVWPAWMENFKDYWNN